MQLNNVSDIIKELKKIKITILAKKNNDAKTKFQLNKLFNKTIKYLEYQNPMPAINISKNGHLFECPRCHTKFESEDTVDMFSGCYVCLQRWKEEE